MESLTTPQVAHVLDDLFRQAEIAMLHSSPN